jgi:hypothetical protein
MAKWSPRVLFSPPRQALALQAQGGGERVSGAITSSFPYIRRSSKSAGESRNPPFTGDSEAGYGFAYNPPYALPGHDLLGR